MAFARILWQIVPKTCLVCVIFVDGFPNVAKAKGTPRNHREYYRPNHRRATQSALGTKKSIDRPTSRAPLAYGDSMHAISDSNDNCSMFPSELQHPDSHVSISHLSLVHLDLDLGLSLPIYRTLVYTY